MRINVEIDEHDVKKWVLLKLQDLGMTGLKIEDIHVETKSKQNYRSEWEEAAFRVRVGSRPS